MTDKARLLGTDWVLATMIAVALVYGFAPWPTPQLTQQVLRYLYPQCFLPFVRCRLPVEDIHLAVFGGLLAITYTAMLVVYSAAVRVVARMSPAETAESS